MHGTPIENRLSYRDVIQPAGSGQFLVRMKEHSATMRKQWFAIRDTTPYYFGGRFAEP
jgi:hypothetical protein